MHSIFLVSYSSGEWDDYRIINVFATQDEDKAKAWVAKTNRILESYKDWYLEHKSPHLKQIETPKRFWDLDQINTAFYTKIEVR
jgi:hypothetical protein